MSETIEEARKLYKNGYYNDKLEQGLQYQDFVTQEFYQRGIVLVGCQSHKFQIQKGENMLGAEIKRDGLFRKTGNLYIEIAEKAHPDNPNYVDSGIMRGDNSWLLTIGDEQTIYIFSVKYLRMLFRSVQTDYDIIEKTTSRGFLLPLEDADKYCLRKIEIPMKKENGQGR